MTVAAVSRVLVAVPGVDAGGVGLRREGLAVAVDVVAGVVVVAVPVPEGIAFAVGPVTRAVHDIELLLVAPRHVGGKVHLHEPVGVPVEGPRVVLGVAG